MRDRGARFLYRRARSVGIGLRISEYVFIVAIFALNLHFSGWFWYVLESESGVILDQDEN